LTSPHDQITSGQEMPLSTISNTFATRPAPGSPDSVRVGGKEPPHSRNAS
jgi:hypothetical protein